VSFCTLASRFSPRALITGFADPTQLAPSLDLPLESLDEDLDLETHSYIACRWLHELHDTVASSFDKVKAQCLSFPDKGGKVEEMIDWVVGEVKGVPDDVW
jgi:hypothetical protein